MDASVSSEDAVWMCEIEAALRDTPPASLDLPAIRAQLEVVHSEAVRNGLGQLVTWAREQLSVVEDKELLADLESFL